MCNAWLLAPWHAPIVLAAQGGHKFGGIALKIISIRPYNISKIQYNIRLGQKWLFANLHSNKDGEI
jgi:hypothetical protein